MKVDISQIKKDRSNGVIVSQQTWDALVAYASDLEADSDRLNWLERGADGFKNIDRIVAEVGKGFQSAQFGNPTWYFKLREAIDASMHPEK